MDLQPPGVIAEGAAVAVPAVALDIDAEDVLYGILVAVEGSACHLHATAHVSLHPPLVQFDKRDAPRTIDGRTKPQ